MGNSSVISSKKSDLVVSSKCMGEFFSSNPSKEKWVGVSSKHREILEESKPELVQRRRALQLPLYMKGNLTAHDRIRLRGDVPTLAGRNHGHLLWQGGRRVISLRRWC
jgi:hypothetical protein